MAAKTPLLTFASAYKKPLRMQTDDAAEHIYEGKRL